MLSAGPARAGKHLLNLGVAQLFNSDHLARNFPRGRPPQPPARKKHPAGDLWLFMLFSRRWDFVFSGTR
jgi:hypothetical protein